MAANKKFYMDEESEEFLNKINYVSEKALVKCSNLSNTLMLKFLIYNATYIYEEDRSLISSRENSNNER